MTTDILIFQTNISTQQDVLCVASYLNEINGISRWSVDLEDVDNVLRIEASVLLVDQIKQIIHSAGYQCNELTD